MKTFHLILVLVTALTSEVTAQSRNSAATEKIHLGGNEYLEVLNCTGETDKRRCELVLLVNGKQVGNSFWLTESAINNIRKSRQSTTIITGETPPKTARLKPKPVIATPSPQEVFVQQPVKKDVQAETKPAKQSADFATQLNNALRGRTANTDPSKKIDSTKN